MKVDCFYKRICSINSSSFESADDGCGLYSILGHASRGFLIPVCAVDLQTRFQKITSSKRENVQSRRLAYCCKHCKTNCCTLKNSMKQSAMLNISKQQQTVQYYTLQGSLINHHTTNDTSCSSQNQGTLSESKNFG